MIGVVAVDDLEVQRLRRDLLQAALITAVGQAVEGGLRHVAGLILCGLAGVPPYGLSLL